MDKEGKAIGRIKMASEMSLSYYGKPLICTYSGGKDSDVMLELFKRSGVPFEVLHSHTTADAPQTVYHVREMFRRLEQEGVRCSIDYHVQPDGSRVTMWGLIVKKLMPPTRFMRYCCSVLKESGTRGRMAATGVRWGESNMRKNRESFEAVMPKKKDAIRISDEKMLLTDNGSTRRLFERCEIKAETLVNPIIDWADSEVWDFYRSAASAARWQAGQGGKSSRISLSIKPCTLRHLAGCCRQGRKKGLHTGMTFTKTGSPAGMYSSGGWKIKMWPGRWRWYLTAWRQAG